MKFSLSLVGAAALALSALPAQAQDANTPTIQTPPAIVQCQPVQVGFAGGQGPYFISILPGVRQEKVGCVSTNEVLIQRHPGRHLRPSNPDLPSPERCRSLHLERQHRSWNINHFPDQRL